VISFCKETGIFISAFAGSIDKDPSRSTARFIRNAFFWLPLLRKPLKKEQKLWRDLPFGYALPVKSHNYHEIKTAFSPVRAAPVCVGVSFSSARALP
jgi:hypothetical protein